MHKTPEIGVVREGMLADMVIVDQNPLQNFKVLYANGTIRLNDKTGRVERVGGIKWTIKDGIAYDAKKLAGRRDGHGREAEARAKHQDHDGKFEATKGEQASTARPEPVEGRAFLRRFR